MITTKWFLVIMVLISLSLSQTANAQLDTVWTRVLGTPEEDVSMSIISTIDDGFLIAGYTYSADHDRTRWLIFKTDCDGEEEWRFIDPDQGTGYCYQCIAATDSTYLVVGSTTAFGNGQSDARVMCLDRFGNVLWNRAYGRESVDTGVAIAQCSETEFYITGQLSPFTKWIVRINVEGDSLASRIYNSGEIDGVGILKSLAGGEALVGGGGTRQVTLGRIDVNFEPLWVRHFEFEDIVVCHSIVIADDGDYLLAGYTHPAEKHSLLIRTNGNGESLWMRRDVDTGYMFSSTINAIGGGQLATGTTTSEGDRRGDLWVRRLNSDGEVLWSQTFDQGVGEEGKDVLQLDDGAYILLGTSHLIADQSGDFWLVKTTPDPTYIPQSGEPVVPISQNLLSAYPNPFNGQVSLNYTLHQMGLVEIEVFDALGRQIATIPQGYQLPGEHKLNWNAEGLPSGQYQVVLKQRDEKVVHQVTLTR